MKERTYLLFSILTLVFLMASCGTSKNKVQATTPEVIVDTIPLMPKEPELLPIQIKYAEILGVAPEEITNLKLYEFVDEWLDTPYKMGGESKRGIDCSAFAQHCYVDVYGYLLERTSNKMDKAKSTDKFIGQEFLKEADILFFKKPNSRDKTITHVGIYLQNDMFVSASGYDGPEKYRGVKISNLKDDWWQERFMHAGRKPLDIYLTEEQ
ncbi:MAG: C40 family peptidase [Aequorivita sp.]